MARSDFPTWLPLDRFAQILGIDPLEFNQLHSTQQRNNTCGQIWFQHDWQHSNRVGRETLAMALQQAERNIAREVGYNLIPDWTVEERLPYPRPSNPSVYGVWGTNVRGQMKSVEVPRGHIITGGVKTKTLIQAGAVFVRTDDDTDGYAETCTATIPTTVTDPNEIHLYYPAKNGSDAWEIRPIEVTLSGVNAIIVFKSWQVVAANQMENINPNVLLAEDAASYETTVDVYRVYNDPATQAQFIWEGDPSLCNCGNSSCLACQLGTQAGCFHLRDARVGVLVPSPATWDSAQQGFTSMPWAACREPDQVRFWYYSGYRDMSLARPYVQMSPYWEYAVAYYAASLLDRPTCGCTNTQAFIDHWRRDASFKSDEQGAFNLPDQLSTNRLGTTMGAIFAFRRIHQNGVIVNK